MPLILEKQISDAKKMGVWEITETLSFFEEKVALSFPEGVSEKRKLEQLVSAHLLNTLFGEEVHAQLSRTEKGKPFLQNNMTSLSFSHSHRMIACLIDKSGGPSGIDIEETRERISKIAHKFVNDDDGSPLKSDQILHQHLIWGAKEVLYKIHGEKELDFLRHISVKFDKKWSGMITKNPQPNNYNLDYQILDNFTLVWNF